MILSYLDPLYRSLFLIYAKNGISDSELIPFFPKNIDVIKSLEYLVLDGTLKRTVNGFELDQYKKSNFLKIIKFFFEEMEIPQSRTKLNSILKSKESSTIFTQLIKAKLLFEYKTDTSNKEYLLPITKKDEMIKIINEFELNCMENADDFDTQSRYIMVMMGDDIRLRKGTIVNCYDITFNDNELVILVNLYDDLVIRKIRAIGKTMNQISQLYFNGNDTIACNTIHSLIKKHIIRCSMQNYYYINESLVPTLSEFYEHYKDFIIHE